MIRLYVIDDHFMIIEGFYSSFDLESEDFKVVGGSLNIKEALEKISSKKVDIIILDLHIGRTNEIDNIELIRSHFPNIPVVIYSFENSLQAQLEMFQHGAKAFINKEEDKSILRQRLLQVYQGERVIPDEVAEILLTNEYQNVIVMSSENQEILSLLLQGMVPKEIAKRLHQSESAIDRKLQRIREVFQVKNNYKLILKLLHKEVFR